MRVAISVPGKFHAFDLARELEKRGWLERIVTAYPRFKFRDYHIARSQIRSIPFPDTAFRAWRRLPRFLRTAYNPHYLVSEWYDSVASKQIGNCDICVAWAGYALHTLRRAQVSGAVTVVERGSSHIEYQTEILQEEYAKFGADIRLAHPKIIQKELQEYEAADYISIPSLFVKRSFLEKGVPERKLIHVPYGVDLSKFRQLPKQDDVFRVVFAGGMSLRKGVHYLLRAFSELKLPNSELLLLGGMNEEMKPFFKKYSGQFQYMGHRPFGELYQHFSNSSVFVIMSIEEGLALVQPQAMACGLPVVCTTNTGGEDIVRDGKDGFIIPIRSVSALKEKLTYLYEHPEKCVAMGQSAKERVRDGFTWSDYGNTIAKEYERIVSIRQK